MGNSVMESFFDEYMPCVVAYERSCGPLMLHRKRGRASFRGAGQAASRVRLEQLPGYAPDLNPEEGIWKHLKYVELKNLCCQSLAELKVELRKAKERLRHKIDVILGCIRHPRFEL